MALHLLLNLAEDTQVEIKVGYLPVTPAACLGRASEAPTHAGMAWA